jgi:hypothetical protein
MGSVEIVELMKNWSVEALPSTADGICGDSHSELLQLLELLFSRLLSP